MPCNISLPPSYVLPQKVFTVYLSLHSLDLDASAQCMHTYIHTYIHVNMYIHTYIYTYMYVCMYACMHVYKHFNFGGFVV